MKEIKLSQQGKYKGKHVALVDDEDFKWISGFRWAVMADTNTHYATSMINKKPVKMHRLILGLIDPKIKVDHKDRNGLNNCRDNLRIATTTQNAQNRKKATLINGKPTTSKYKGVSWCSTRGKWIVYVKVNGKAIYVGQYLCEIDAARSHDKFVEKHHGDFARLNGV
jgi:hypothetical protein